MTDAELLESINALRTYEGDTHHLEAKAAIRDLPRRLWETLSSFSNTPGGGVIILGLDERSGFEPVGVQDPSKIQSDLASLCDNMEPPLRPLIELHRTQDRVLITAEVPELPLAQKPAYYRGAGLTNGAFIRVGDGDRLLTPYEVQTLLASRGQPREDEQPVPEAGVEDLDGDLLGSYLGRLRADEASPLRGMTDEALLRSTRILVPAQQEGTRWVPSMGGLLALGRHPQQFWPSLDITFVVYPTPEGGVSGPGGERFLDNRRVIGSIPWMVLRTMEALKRNMKRRAIVHGMYREDVWEYPEEALREALVNALVHRDYSAGARGTPVQVQMYPDRLSIVNPGGLFGPVTVDRLGEAGVSAARNATLLRILEDLPIPGTNRTLCENRGSGIAAMLGSLRKAGMQPPEFRDAIATFRVTFGNHTLLDEETLSWLGRVAPPGITDDQRMALAYIRRNGAITNEGYRRLTGRDSREVSRALKQMVEAGSLVQAGTRRWATYRLPGKEAGHRDAGLSTRLVERGLDRRDEICAILRNEGPRSRLEIQERLGVSRLTALKWLKQLVAEGVIEYSAAPRSKLVKYRLVVDAPD